MRAALPTVQGEGQDQAEGSAAVESWPVFVIASVVLLHRGPRIWALRVSLCKKSCAWIFVLTLNFRYRVWLEENDLQRYQSHSCCDSGSFHAKKGTHCSPRALGSQ